MKVFSTSQLLASIYTTNHYHPPPIYNRHRMAKPWDVEPTGGLPTGGHVAMARFRLDLNLPPVVEFLSI